MLTDDKSNHVPSSLYDKLLELVVDRNESLSELQSDPLFTEVLHELCNGSLDNLTSTLQQSRFTQKCLQGQLESLVAEHYPVFLAKADTSRNVLSDISNIISVNSKLISHIPDAISCSQDFLTKAGQINDAIKANTKALDHHVQLLELLELPQLMETSVNNGHFDDAIAILTYTKQMLKKHGSSISIIRMIASQVNRIGCQLVHQLCNQLRSRLKLPACIQVIMFLRRTGVFTEPELRLKFLQTRTACLDQLLASTVIAPRTGDAFSKDVTSATGGFRTLNRSQYEAYRRATHRIEVTREHLFDIITQYRTVFPDDTQLHSSNIRTTNGVSSVSDKTTDLLMSNPLIVLDEPYERLVAQFGSNIFHAWLTHRITLFLDSFAVDLKQILHHPSVQELVDQWWGAGNTTTVPPASVANPSDFNMETVFTQVHSLMSQSLYFARSFSRIGCDFRPHLIDLFQLSLLTFVKTYLDDTVSEFAVALENLVWRLDDVAGPMRDNETESSSTYATTADRAFEHLPKDRLVCHPPLVILFNRFMGLFSGLRLCCPVALKHELIKALVVALHSSANRLVTAYRALVDQQPINWRSGAADFAGAFATILVPYVLTCLLGRLFAPPPQASVDTTTRSSTQLLIHRLGRLSVTPVTDTWPHVVLASGTMDCAPTESKLAAIDGCVESCAAGVCESNEQCSNDETPASLPANEADCVEDPLNHANDDDEA